jgi:hypothetical protein
MSSQFGNIRSLDYGAADLEDGRLVGLRGCQVAQVLGGAHGHVSGVNVMVGQHSDVVVVEVQVSFWWCSAHLVGGGEVMPRRSPCLAFLCCASLLQGVVPTSIVPPSCSV